ncbi:helix-turn-helix domain-containing protein [Neolewinella aurantiaca]|uniref:Helix-turn-helix domain-containing protein n=1 Tax=Neolewinella aurantiaca TaxID=2602767 RepID=A0A5C7FS07_9BACT|nr:AraC family transcriptional regulator [Neolewinella aurantiaca]TXF88926.1 helix-turn-helix domain-containing protein [Neolewinella aurantiaca]
MNESTNSHIPLLSTITEFYRAFGIGTPQSDQFSVMRIEDQPMDKRRLMPLFRSNFYRLILFTSPGVEFMDSGRKLSSSGNSMYFAYPGKLESWQVIAPVVHGYAICFTAEFAQLDPQAGDFATRFPFFRFDTDNLSHFSAPESEPLETTAELMLAEIKNPTAERFDILKHLLHIYLLQSRRLFKECEDCKSAEDQRAALVHARFLSAIDNQLERIARGLSDEQPTVASIAAELNLHPSYLNDLLKKLTGSTASSIIQRKIILEAKSYLQNTELQVAEVAYQLGFTSANYFSRYFKQHAGSTPNSFRRA